MKVIEKVRHYYDVMGDLSHTNLVLKICLTVVGICLFTALIMVAKLASRPPLIITILPDGEAIATEYQIDSSTSVEKTEVRRFINAFLVYRYNWNPNTIVPQFKKAQNFMSPNLRKEMDRKISEDIAYVKNTEMTQHLYIKKIEPANSKPFKKRKEYSVIGDRVIGIKGAKFTTNFKVLLTVQKQKRNHDSKSGLRIVALKETLSKTENDTNSK